MLDHYGKIKIYFSFSKNQFILNYFSIPADPSWPKIPQRKLIDDVDDTIEPPCIVTLTGTPRRSRTIVQTPLNQ